MPSPPRVTAGDGTVALSHRWIRGGISEYASRWSFGPFHALINLGADGKERIFWTAGGQKVLPRRRRDPLGCSVFSRLLCF